MEYVYLERFEQLSNFQRTCNLLPVFQPILFGDFLAVQVDWPLLPVRIFLLFFSSSVLAKECYQRINEYCEEIGTLPPSFFSCFSNNKYFKSLKDTRSGNFLFLFMKMILKYPQVHFCVMLCDLACFRLQVILKSCSSLWKNPFCLQNVEIWSKTD